MKQRNSKEWAYVAVICFQFVLMLWLATKPASCGVPSCTCNCDCDSNHGTSQAGKGNMAASPDSAKQGRETSQAGKGNMAASPDSAKLDPIVHETNTKPQRAKSKPVEVTPAGKPGPRLRTSAASTLDRAMDHIKQVQLDNYRRNVSLLYNFHITHHAGTTFCALAKRNGPVPHFACFDNNAKILKGLHDARNFDLWRRDYHMVGGEYGWRMADYGGDPSTIMWEHPHLVSVFVARDPMERMLAVSDGYVRHHWGENKKNWSAVDWDQFAHDPQMTNNYALDVLGYKDHSDKGLEKAKRLVDRFTFVLDMACLNDNLLALCDLLGWEMLNSHDRSSCINCRHKHLPVKERIPNQTVYEFLVQRNDNDIKLYEYAKTLSLVKCDSKA